VDGGRINVIDSTSTEMLKAFAGDLRARGIRLGFANLRTEVRALLERSGVKAALGEGALFPTLKSAVASCEPPASRKHLADKDTTQGVRLRGLWAASGRVQRLWAFWSLEKVAVHQNRRVVCVI
jgi:hypothetical protein